VVPNFSLVDNTWLLADTDGDGLSNGAELRLGSDPLSADSNQDGLKDGVEFASGKSPTNADTDADGLLNADELARGTNPLVADTDGDGVLDGADCYPLDPTRTGCGTPNPLDVTPPVITIVEPPNSIPIP